MSDAWDYPTPSQAEGERDPDTDEHPDVARSTPSQAEGERTADTPADVRTDPAPEER
jgi:hypothetical protein